MTGIEYTRWKPSLIFQRPTIGSRWFYGNFAIGLVVDSHPRFVNIMFCFGFVEVGIGFTRDVTKESLAKAVADVCLKR